MQLNEIYYEVNTTFIPKQVGFIRAVVVAGRQPQKKGREQHAGFGSGVWGLAKRVDLFCSHPGTDPGSRVLGLQLNAAAFITLLSLIGGRQIADGQRSILALSKRSSRQCSFSVDLFEGRFHDPG